MMDERINRIAATANIHSYDTLSAKEFVDGSPHIRHATLRQLYAQLAVAVYDFSLGYTAVPHVLDLGAGDGSVTLPFLELGAVVTAIDSSQRQLDRLQATCAQHAARLAIYCDDVFDAVSQLRSRGKRFDIIVASSFLHHIPDYLHLIRESTSVLSPHGQFFSFQDPLRYDSMRRYDHTFSTVSFITWRMFHHNDLIGGIRRRIRRSRGDYLDDRPEDNAEYHVIRNGVDQNAIDQLLMSLGFCCNITTYFSTQSNMWQSIGEKIGTNNSFAIIARPISHSDQTL